MENIREKADKWWRELPYKERVKYATEYLEKKGHIFKYNNDGYIIGITISEVVEMYQSYLKDK